MVFSSAIFIFAFLPVVFIIYRLLPNLKARNAFLAFASIVFYAFGQLNYIPLFLLSIAVNYAAGRLLLKYGQSKPVIVAAVVLNIGVLCFFKFGSVVENSGIILPIGISFFTFQGLSYVIDTYRDRNCGTKDFVKLLLYISFFPQLIAGPIVKYHDVAEQIDSRTTSAEETAAGIRRFVLGLSKKVLIANTVGLIADTVYNTYLKAPGALDWRFAWIGAVCYSLQIYFDFSGYSDMAIGLGHMFGFTFKENFLFPYGSSSIKEFWRKWHVSLSTWFKEYLYIPLGGNRKGKFRTALNKMTVFVCTGIWHGANWTFLFWGVMHGILSSIDIKFKRKWMGHIYTMLCVVLLFAVFRADNITEGFKIIASMFMFRTVPGAALELSRLLTPFAVTVIAAAVLTCAGFPFDREKLPVHFRNTLSICALVLCFMSIASGGFNPFIYFQF